MLSSCELGTCRRCGSLVIPRRDGWNVANAKRDLSCLIPVDFLEAARKLCITAVVKFISGFLLSHTEVFP